jgi:hypothetical protein
VRRKFFTVVVGQHFHPVRKGLESFDNGHADQVGCLVSHLDYDPEAALALDHSHNGALMVRANDRVAFPVAYLLSSFDMRRPITQGAPMRDLAPPVPLARVAFSFASGSEGSSSACRLEPCQSKHAGKAPHG